MKFKKIISSLTSLALASSLIASNSVFASAEEEFDVWAIIGADASDAGDWGYCYWGEGAKDNKGNVTSEGAKISDNGTATVKLTLENPAKTVYVINPCVNLDSNKYGSAVLEVTECKIDGEAVDVDLTIKGGQVSWFEQTGDGMYMRGAGYNEYGDQFIAKDDCQELTTVEFTVRLDLDGDGFDDEKDDSKEEDKKDDTKEDDKKDDEKDDTPADTDKEEDKKDDDKKDDDKKDDSTSTSDAPTVSFDAAAWKNYVKLTPDASIAGITLNQINTDSYQATSLVVKANMTTALPDKTFPTYASSLNDDDGNPIYPGAYEDDVTLVHMGFELNASDFGLESFNGCTIEFYHLFNEKAADVLMNEAMYIYPANDDYEVMASAAKVLKVDTLTRQNIDYYKKDFIAIAPQLEGQDPATKVVFELPFINGYSGEAFRMDNIKIIKPDGTVCENIDGYNSTFSPRNESDGKIVPGSAQTVDVEENTNTNTTTNDNDKGGFNPLIIVVVVLVIGAIALVVVLLIKNKNRYY